MRIYMQGFTYIRITADPKRQLKHRKSMKVGRRKKKSTIITSLLPAVTLKA